MTEVLFPDLSTEKGIIPVSRTLAGGTTVDEIETTAFRSSPCQVVLRVSLVDSKPNGSDSAVQAMRRIPCDLQIALDGFAALRMAAIHHPHVVILQLDLPWMSGFQLASHLRQDFPRSGMLIVGLTMIKRPETRRLSSQSGIDVLVGERDRRTVLETIMMLECVRLASGGPMT
jgi:CheY-like chemotaxis protein